MINLQDVHVELTIDQNNYAIEKINIKDDKLWLNIPERLDKELPAVGLLTISGSDHFFAKVVFNISGTDTENDKTVFICDLPPIDYNEYQRSYARVETLIPLEFTYLQPDNTENLKPVSPIFKGFLENISPGGARVQLPLDTGYSNMKQPVFIILNLSLPTGKQLQLVGKIVNYQKGTCQDYAGVMFLLQSYNDYQAIAEFYAEHMKAQDGAKEKINLKNIINPFYER